MSKSKKAAPKKAAPKPKKAISNLETPDIGRNHIKEYKENDLLLLECPKCNGIHFRHAGYVSVKNPVLLGDRDAKIETMDKPVNICINCKTALVEFNGRVYDISKKIDLQAWDKTEKEMHKATGPGGQC